MVRLPNAVTTMTGASADRRRRVAQRGQAVHAGQAHVEQMTLGVRRAASAEASRRTPGRDGIVLACVSARRSNAQQTASSSSTIRRCFRPWADAVVMMQSPGYCLAQRRRHAGARGKTMRKIVCPSSRRRSMRPPWASATRRATARPRPTPSGFEVTNSSKSWLGGTRCRWPGAGIADLDADLAGTSRRTWTATAPPPATASMALPRTLTNRCPRCVLSAWTMIGSAGSCQCSSTWACRHCGAEQGHCLVQECAERAGAALEPVGFPQVQKTLQLLFHEGELSERDLQRFLVSCGAVTRVYLHRQARTATPLRS